MNFHFFFFARSAARTACFATKYLPVTCTRGARFSFWEIDNEGKAIGPKKTVEWSYKNSSQFDELKMALGPNWQVFSHFQTLQKIGQ